MADIITAKRAIPTIDLGNAWDSLPQDAQRTIGKAAVAMGLRDMAMMVVSEVSDDVAVMLNATDDFFETAYDEAVVLIDSLIQTHVLGGEIDRILPPSLAGLGVRQCDACGCTDERGCAEGCHWVGPVRCSRCGVADV